MGSTRLPQKVLADLAGMPMLGHIIERLKSSTPSQRNRGGDAAPCL